MMNSWEVNDKPIGRAKGAEDKSGEVDVQVSTSTRDCLHLYRCFAKRYFSSHLH